MSTGVGVLIDQVGVPSATILEQGQLAAKVGVDGLWLVQQPNQRDTTMLLAALAASTESVSIGSAVLPMYSRPPVVMAQTALTLDEMFGARFILGLGAGHRMVGEWMLGVGYPPPAAAMREYLTVVTDLIRTGEVNVSGRWFSGHMSYSAPRRSELPVYVGTRGPRMLELAAELADGVILWMCTPEDVRDRVMPHVQKGLARRGTGCREFEIVLMLNTAVSTSPEEHREAFRRTVSGYLRMENYRKQYAASGFGEDLKAGRVSDRAVRSMAAIGDVHEVGDRMDAFRDAGVTQLAVAPMVDGTGPEGAAHFTRMLEAVLGG